ncbi:hypothetical protein AYO49_03270 [Verrucomicrobiaceae bacterium SCGC AG-212-N21]|nr:hypothetical protein AYO49_03270 [Verrucomicrobiaceae bacterium SCGC AG-212-N21]
MKLTILLHSLLVTSLCLTIGCSSSSEFDDDDADIHPPQSNKLYQKEIYSRLRRERVPYPDNTVYAGDGKERRSFDKGFRLGWERAISSANLDASLWHPEEPDKRQEAWRAGIESGMKAGRERWMQEFKRVNRGSGAYDSAGMDLNVMPQL